MAKRVTKGNLWGFIQSRPYASVADIRRLFTIDVEDASAVDTSEGTYYIGLSREAADLIRQLWQEGRIVLDVNPDVRARVVQGIYPARAPLGRQPAAGAAPMPAVALAVAGAATLHRQAASEDRAQEGPPATPAAAVDSQTASSKRRRRRRRRATTAATATVPLTPGPSPTLTRGEGSTATTAATATAAASTAPYAE